eukprot:1185497-Prorocentrum_minimum.AAC.3
MATSWRAVSKYSSSVRFETDKNHRQHMTRRARESGTRVRHPRWVRKRFFTGVDARCRWSLSERGGIGRIVRPRLGVWGGPPTFTRLSSLPDTTQRPSGLKRICETPLECPL